MRTKLLSIIIILAGFSACGEIVDFGDDSTNWATGLSLSRDTLTLMPGDSCLLTPVFTPADATKMNVFWLSDDDEVATMANDTIVAVGEGSTNVNVSTVNGALKTSVHVKVLTPWQIDTWHYPYETMVYAQVTVRGQAFDPTQMQVGAFIDDELRGMAQVREANGKSYVLVRVYSETNATAKIQFRCYDRKAARLDVFTQSLTFDGESHGTLSNLLQLTIE